MGTTAKPTKPKRPSAGRPRLHETEDGQAKIERFLEVVREGNFRRDACHASGLSERNVARWVREAEEGAPQSSVDFVKRLLEAEADAVLRNVRIVLQAALADAKHAEWWLERKRPEDWGRKDRVQAEVTGTLQVDHGSEAIESLTRAIASIAARSQQERGNSQSDAGTGEGASD